ncbi:DsrE family protein [Marinoscillum pacificum]|uniref:DsrE family protein n=1 Tax=Marinoscillum pacificum TaxID=392723 RepID=UPI002157D12A|nr:DsrE family protein [Marinoscillum pacificum]
MRTLFIFALTLVSISAIAQELEYPVIKGYGGVVRAPEAIMPTEGGKIIIDIASDQTTGEGTNKSLDRVARLINLYGLAGIQPSQLDVAVIVHGGATKTVISNAGFNEKYGTDNPDLLLIKALKEQGVKVMVCSQALLRRGFKQEWLNEEVDLTLSAITTLVEYQQKGYSTLIY